MKTLRILMWVVSILLIFLIATHSNNNRGDFETETEDTIFDSPLPPINPDSIDDEIDGIEEAPSIEDDRLVACQACVGMGHNPFENPCIVCNGNGYMSESTMLKRYEQWKEQVVVCPWCQGTGLSYRARTMSPLEWDLIAPPGYYNCKVCNGKKKGTIAELINNFRINSAIYGADL